MMINATQIRKGMVIIHNGEPHKVMDFRFTMQGRGSNTISAKLRNILSENQTEVRFRSDDKVEKAFVSEEEFEFLYQDGEDFVFMNTENFEQIHINKSEIEDVVGYLLPNTTLKVQVYEGNPIGISLPSTVQMKVTETEPSIKGATAAGNVTKPATLETGLVIQVPMFVETGNTVIVNTQTGEYSGRPRD
ncbi:MAG: elongation factor P [Chitinivibrionales bacterium]|nr:elongation factor P [Chitinivibrionales bacterium]